jgi:hypothetical protein
MPPQPKPSFSRGRKWAIGFNVAIGALSALALVIMANYLASRHAIRYNWADSAGTTLSPLTVRALNSLTNTVKVIVFFDRHDNLFGPVTSLIKDYQLRSPKLDVEMVDYRYPGRADLIRTQYRLTSPGDQNRVIFDCNGRVRTVLGSELSEYALGKDKEFRRAGFKGEQLFTSALVSVSTARHGKAYFLTGHGESDPESKDDNSGYSQFARMIEQADVELAMLDTSHRAEVPDDCSLLIIPGATSRFGREELEQLDRYLTRGGRMLVLFSMVDPKRPETGLEKLMANWNVEVGPTNVRDNPKATSNGDFNVVASDFGGHAITRALMRSSVNLVFPRMVAARPSGSPKADAPKTTELIFTSQSGMALRVLDDGVHAEVIRTNSVPMAVAVEKGGIQGVSSDRGGATRIVAVGSSFSFANRMLYESANADFANLALNWLLSRDTLLTDIAPRAMKSYTITVTEEQMARLRWILLGAAPTAALAIGALVWLKRRS